MQKNVLSANIWIVSVAQLIVFMKVKICYAHPDECIDYGALEPERSVEAYF